MRIEADGDDVLVWIKAVPGASRDEVVGVIGERLKIRITAPPEGGKANKAICKLLAKTLGVKASQIAIETGQSSPEKIVRIADGGVGGGVDGGGDGGVERIRNALAR